MEKALSQISIYFHCSIAPPESHPELASELASDGEKLSQWIFEQQQEMVQRFQENLNGEAGDEDLGLLLFS